MKSSLHFQQSSFWILERSDQSTDFIGALDLFECIFIFTIIDCFINIAVIKLNGIQLE